MDPLTVSKSLNGMLSCSGFSAKFPHTKMLRPKYQSRIGGTRICGLSRSILDSTSRLKRAYLLTLLRFAFYFFSDKTKGEHCLNGPSLQQSPCIETTFFAIGPQRLGFGM